MSLHEPLIWLPLTLRTTETHKINLYKFCKTLPEENIIEVAFLNGAPKTINTRNGWVKIPDSSPEKKLSESVLDTLTKKSHQNPKRLYGLMLLDLGAHPAPKLLKIELNPTIDLNGKWRRAIKPLIKSYDKLLEIALNLPEIKPP